MVGRMQLQSKNYNDPFNAGQMVGMLVMLTFIEKNNGIDSETIDNIKRACVDNVQPFFGKPTEDIFLMVEDMIKEIK